MGPFSNLGLFSNAELISIVCGLTLKFQKGEKTGLGDSLFIFQFSFRHATASVSQAGGHGG